MTPLRFCFLTTFYPPYHFGGDAIAVRRLARALVQRGHSVTVAHDVDAYRALAGGREPLAEREDDGVEVVSLRSRAGAASALLTQQLGRPVVHGSALARLLDRGRFDVIHYHNISLVGGPGLLSLGRAAKLYTAHEHWLVCPTHVLWRDGREACDTRACLRCTLRQGRPPQLWRHTGYLERQVSHVDAFIAQSEFSRERHLAYGFARDMEVIPPFLPAAETGPSEGAARPQSRPYFLFAGRLERMKGLHTLLPLFRGDGEAELLVAGEGSQGAELRGMAADLPRVRFLGRLDDAALRRYLRHAVALLVPTIGYETFGLVVIEAFREGTPVIARRIGPFPELLEACRGGELYGTEEELGRAMDRMRSDPGYRRACSAAARRGVRERWSEEAVLPRYLDLAERVLTERRRGSRPLAEVAG